MLGSDDLGVKVTGPPPISCTNILLGEEGSDKYIIGECPPFPVRSEEISMERCPLMRFLVFVEGRSAISNDLEHEGRRKMSLRMSFIETLTTPINP